MALKGGRRDRLDGLFDNDTITVKCNTGSLIPMVAIIPTVLND